MRRPQVTAEIHYRSRSGGLPLNAAGVDTFTMHFFRNVPGADLEEQRAYVTEYSTPELLRRNRPAEVRIESIDLHGPGVVRAALAGVKGGE